MSKRDIPQPEWPELTFFEDGKPRCVAPVVAKDGSATYPTDKMGARAVSAVSEFVAQRKATKP